MPNKKKYHERFSEAGVSIFTTTQTDNRIALCKEALTSEGFLLRLTDSFGELGQERFRVMDFDVLAFNRLRDELFSIAWGGRYLKVRNAVEGGLYPFVRCQQRNRPVDRGVIWIGTRYEYPRIYVTNYVAEWISPYTAGGSVMTEPFESLARVTANWAKLSNYVNYPDLDLPLTPPI